MPNTVQRRATAARDRALSPESTALLTEREAAAVLRLQPTTLESWRIRKTGPALPFIKLGRVVRYRRADIERLIADSTEQPAEAAL